MVFLDIPSHGKLFKEFINSDHACQKHWHWSPPRSQPSITCHPSTLPNQIHHCLHNIRSMAAILISIQHLHPCLHGVQWHSIQSRHALATAALTPWTAIIVLESGPNSLSLPPFSPQFTALEDAFVKVDIPKLLYNSYHHNSWSFCGRHQSHIHFEVMK